MTPTYVFRYRRIGQWFFRKVRVQGHAHQADADKMVLVLPGGAIREIAEWKRVETHLGIDWALAQKFHLEQQAGREIPTNIKHQH